MKKHARLAREQLEIKRLKTQQVSTRIQDAVQNVKGIDRGHAMIDSVRGTLRVIDKRSNARTSAQISAHEYILASGASYFYGEDFHSNELKIKTRNRFESLLKGVLLTAPRRFGKTVIIIMMIVALMLNCPNIVIVCVSGNKNAAGQEVGILGKVRKCLMRDFGVLRSSFDRKNDQHLMYKINDGDVRELHSYSGKSGDR